MQPSIASVLASGTAPTESPSLPLWERLMRQAVDATRARQSAAARAGYERALSIARHLLDDPPPGRAEDCLAALVVSHHNLADTFVEQNDIDMAAHHLCQAHDVLIALHLSAERAFSLRHAALRHSRETHMALIRHIARHGPHARITRTLQAAGVALHADSPARH